MVAYVSHFNSILSGYRGQAAVRQYQNALSDAPRLDRGVHDYYNRHLWAFITLRFIYQWFPDLGAMHLVRKDSDNTCHACKGPKLRMRASINDIIHYLLPVNDP